MENIEKEALRRKKLFRSNKAVLKNTFCILEKSTLEK
jgi:hypothetical protein